MSKFPIVPSVELQQANSSNFDSDSNQFLSDETQDAGASHPLPNSSQSIFHQDNPVASESESDHAQDSGKAAAEIIWLFQELNNELLAHIKCSSFLELLCLAYFLGANEHLLHVRAPNVDRAHFSDTSTKVSDTNSDTNSNTNTNAEPSPMLKRLVSRLGYSNGHDKIENCRRLIANNSLLKQFFLDGQRALSCYLAREVNIHNSLQQLVSQYAHYSLLDLNQFNASPYYAHNESNYRTLDIKPTRESSRAAYIVLAILLFLTLSAAGSYAVLYFVFPEILQALL